MINQFEIFFTNKENVNMSSYRSDSTLGLPILYLQDHKTALWNRFHEQYSNRMCKTTFMTRLEGNRFLFQNNLGGLCASCNDCGYEIINNINI
ncbi:hypothetical protein F8M41_014743 [Gigaspora margarita]|uniref:Uncharacterized protein n=1 Tax=Gigaspora margarita TaxID=4874 RepID=A0A8H3WWT9_GIGMA|nr:hypothetical protein F8M41_014743 [Gigaspora margarita]